EPSHGDASLTAKNTEIPQAMLQPFPALMMQAFPISTKVKSLKYDAPGIRDEAVLEEGDCARVICRSDITKTSEPAHISPADDDINIVGVSQSVGCEMSWHKAARALVALVVVALAA